MWMRVMKIAWWCITVFSQNDSNKTKIRRKQGHLRNVSAVYQADRAMWGMFMFFKIKSKDKRARMPT